MTNDGSFLTKEANNQEDHQMTKKAASDQIIDLFKDAFLQQQKN